MTISLSKVTFSFQVTENISHMVIAVIISNMVLNSLCLSQLVVTSTHMSPFRYFEFAAEFASLLLEFFIVCNSSEMLDDCSIMVVNAIKYSNWHKCSSRTRRDVCVMLRRAQRPNHAKFHQGALVISRQLFMKVLKTVYSFVNFMRFMRS
uniref:Uncharacterized protein n=2 Tax=Cacopsylla melanoneura TaxID=428564 RepID=A0A8D8X4L1_9HEMI